MKFIILICSLFLIQCAQTKKMEQEKQQGVSWRADMHKLANSLSKLLPLAVSSQKFHKKKNQKLIENELKQMKEASKQIEKNTHATKGDPVLMFTAQKFSQDLDYAYEQFKIGNTDFAQSHIRNATRYCMGCHTRNGQGQQFDWNWGVDLKALDVIDRAQYLTAIRDFDKALESYKSILSNKKLAKTNQAYWADSAKKSMAIAVRVKRDPDFALSIVDKVLNEKSVPPSMLQTVLQWQKALVQWKKEEKRKIKKKSFKQQLSRANALLQRGWQSTQFPQSSAGSIYFLRSSSILHDLLEMKVTQTEKAQALYSSGLVAEKLKDINLWTLHEAYYEACIRVAPRTQLAKKCYLRYEAVVIANYLSSPYNGQVPVHVRHHLDNLRKTAEMGDWNELLNWGLVE